MSTISHIQHIVSVIRQAAAGQGVAATTQGAPRRPARAHSPSRTGRATVLSMIGPRIRALDKTSPDRPRRTFRIFLEAVLVAEFGDALLNDPSFFRMVEDIQTQMESDAAIAKAIDAATARLMEQADATPG